MSVEEKTELSTELYFGFASNMSRSALSHKGLSPLSIRRGVLRGWRLNFSLKHPSGGDAMGNIVMDKDFSLGVHGSVIELSIDDMKRMDSLEVGYLREPVKIEIYEEDGGGTLTATAYRATEESVKTLCKDLTIEESLGDWNYRNTILVGAETIGLKTEYIDYLRSLPVIDRVDWDESRLSKLEWFDREYTWDEVDDDPDLAAQHGYVISIAHSPPGFQRWMRNAGTEITHLTASRWAYSTDETRKQKHFEDWPDELKLYVDCMTMRILLGQVDFLWRPVGRIKDGEKYSPRFFDWKLRKYYFGFGSNLSVASLALKKIKVLSIKRGILCGYRVCFNIYDANADESMGNIIKDDDFALGVHGSVMELSGDQLAKLDRFEGTYQRIDAFVTLYDEDGGDRVQCSVYFATPDSLTGGRILKESHGDWNYRDTVVRGAKELGLKSEYIEYLMSLPVIDPVEWDEEWIQSQVWFSNVYTMDEVKKLPFHSVIGGYLFDSSHAAPFVRDVVERCDHDMNLFLAKRWAYSDKDTSDDPKTFPKELQVYFDCYLMRMLQNKKKRMFKPIGRLDDSEPRSRLAFEWHFKKHG